MACDVYRDACHKFQVVPSKKLLRQLSTDAQDVQIKMNHAALDSTELLAILVAIMVRYLFPEHSLNY